MLKFERGSENRNGTEHKGETHHEANKPVVGNMFRVHDPNAALGSVQVHTVFVMNTVAESL